MKKNMFVYRAYMDFADNDAIHKYTEEELYNTSFDEEEIISSIRERCSYNNFFWKRTREEIEVEEDYLKNLRENLVKNSNNKNISSKVSIDKTINFFLRKLSDFLVFEIKNNKKLFFKRTKKNNNPALFLKGYNKTVAVAYSCRVTDDENIDMNIFYDPSYIQKEEAQKYVSDFLTKNEYEVLAGRQIKITFSEKYRGV